MRKIFLFCLFVHVCSGLFGPRKTKPKLDLSNKFKLRPVPAVVNSNTRETQSENVKPNNEVVATTDNEEGDTKTRGKTREEIQSKLKKARGVNDVIRMFSTKYASATPVAGAMGRKEGMPSMGIMSLVMKSGESQQINFATRGGCEPVTACHDLRHLSHVHDGEIWPSSITYKKCGGCCMDHEKPVPVAYHNPTKVNVIVIPYNGEDIKIKEFEFVEHRECRCECKVKASDCKANEIYDAWSCKCECDPNARKECGIYKHWSNIACGCVCAHPDTVCPSGGRFNTNTCQCQQ